MKKNGACRPKENEGESRREDCIRKTRYENDALTSSFLLMCNGRRVYNWCARPLMTYK